jgi:hypothetical protein
MHVIMSRALTKEFSTLLSVTWVNIILKKKKIRHKGNDELIQSHYLNAAQYDIVSFPFKQNRTLMKQF